MASGRALLLLLGIALAALLDSSARAQPEDRTIEIEVHGVTFRIPHRYSFIDVDRARGVVKEKYTRYWFEGDALKGALFDFKLWFSDSKAVEESVRPRLINDGYYWPPEPGRSVRTSDDFVVHAFASPAATDKAIEDMVLSIVPIDMTRTVAIYGKLKCAVDWKALIQISCRTEATEDLVVKVTSGPSRDQYGSLHLQFYSRPDGVRGAVDIPVLALSRWEEVVCKTLALVQDWRVPKPRDSSSSVCTRRVAMNETLVVNEGRPVSHGLMSSSHDPTLLEGSKKRHNL